MVIGLHPRRLRESVETLEKYAQASEIPLYKFFYDGDGQPEALEFPAKLCEPALELTPNT